MTDKEIEKINSNIIKTTKKIKRLEVRDTIIGLAPGAILITSSTVYTLMNSNNSILVYLYPCTLIGSIGLGMIPLSMVCSKNNTKKYKEELNRNLDTLHEEAIKENKILQKKKKNML